MPGKLTTLQNQGDIAECHDPEMLIRALRACAGNVLKNISLMAAILRRLDELGVKVEIDNALLPYIRLIANGKLSAECFLACSGDPSLLELATRLSPDLQKKVAANEPLKLLEAGGTVREVGALDMTQQQIKQAFKGGELRGEAEQRRLIDQKRPARNRDMSNRAVDRQSTLPGSPGNHSSRAGGRCPGCGAKLFNGVECLACNLKNRNKLALAEVAERDYEEYAAMGRQAGDYGAGEDEESDGTLTDGWKDRMADLQRIKEHGNELGFHVDWLLGYLEKTGDEELSSATLAPLLEKLSARFGYELTEAAA